MAIYICNMLGPITTTYRFQNGDMITWLTRESLAYVHRGVSTEVLFWRNDAGTYDYCIPAGLAHARCGAFVEKLERYCRNKRMTCRRVEPDDLAARGKQLRRDIEEYLAGLIRNNELRFGIHGATDVGDILKVYITEGTSFDDGEEILRHAGLTVHERPDLNARDDPFWADRSDKYDVIATTDLRKEFLSRVELIANLCPKSPGDYTSIERVYAAIFAIHL